MRQQLRGRHTLGSVAEWCRYLFERGLLMPAADLLPRRSALALADLSGFVGALLPTSAARTAWAEVAAATGRHGLTALPSVAVRLAMPRRDLVGLRRLRKRREHPRGWTVRHLNDARLWATVEAQRPFVICNGHFPHAPAQALEVLVPGLAGYSMHAPVPARRLSPAALRERLQNRLLYGISRQLIGLPSEVLLPYAGDTGALGRMVDRAREPGGVVRIYFDAVWERPNAYRRPFAGMSERGFAPGTARVARLAQCPIVLALPLFERDGSVRVEWGPWIEAPAPDDEAADIRITDELIDALERAVGRFPLQYQHPIGSERRWDAATQCWRMPATAGGALDQAPPGRPQGARCISRALRRRGRIR
ncbi:MAG: hypothetical protein IVW36_11735 [Dehalococcoidia bacterium]|nr:hypothetical protein [Dehalococcoidia bacterium]